MVQGSIYEGNKREDKQEGNAAQLNVYWTRYRRFSNSSLASQTLLPQKEAYLAS